MESQTTESKRHLESSVDRFIFQWHDFPFDYWWRKKYHVPFGSAAHREMSFIDMYIEYREDLMISRSLEQISAESDGWTPEDEEALGLSDKSGKVVQMSQEEIEEDYENLDLENFNK